jgi:Flp pilus assembly protein TadD
MLPRFGVLGVVLAGLAGTVAILLGLTSASGDDSARSRPPSTPPAVAATDPPPSPPAARDADVAFWEARLADGGGLQSRLHLVDALIERARATGDLADLSRASAVLDAADAAATDIEVLERRGRIAFALHDFSAAREAARKVLAAAPGRASALALLGDASLELGDEAAADRAYEDLEAAGRGPAILSRLARRAWLDGAVGDAETLVREAIRGALLVGSADERAFYHYQLAEMLRWRNALDEAEVEYRAALADQPDHVPSMGGLARVLEARGQREDAIRLLEAATARLPAPDFVATLGDLYALSGRFDDAEDQWALVERIGELAEANGAIYDRQLVVFLADHQRDNARAVALAEAEIESRQDVYGYDALAWALYAAGRYAEAHDVMAEALRLGTPDARFRYHAGMIALALGDAAEAREHLLAARAADAALPPLQLPRLDAALEELGS